MRTDCSVRAVAVHKQSAYIVKMGLIMTSSPYLIETLVLILHLVFRVGISDRFQSKSRKTESYEFILLDSLYFLSDIIYQR